MSDDVHKAKAHLTRTRRERETKAAEFWDRTIVIGQQSDAGKAIQRESLKAAERSGQRMKTH